MSLDRDTVTSNYMSPSSHRYSGTSIIEDENSEDFEIADDLPDDWHWCEAFNQRQILSEEFYEEYGYGAEYVCYYAEHGSADEGFTSKTERLWVDCEQQKCDCAERMAQLPESFASARR